MQQDWFRQKGEELLSNIRILLTDRQELLDIFDESGAPGYQRGQGREDEQGGDEAEDDADDGDTAQAGQTGHIGQGQGAEAGHGGQGVKVDRGITTIPTQRSSRPKPAR